ncbi:cupin domain-containing protein [Salinisphaera sp. Q1T1-3]|uniref:cupin domain-containing protein n=1 Tax=Salinisphaera sp. Q1T1-3 TaxID=2321229 RepID=UPI000E73659B|nr:cupin domain-containing protein [Salinisphaera sp. Q1T1-3]RJS91972.1 cupin domain-containing protein [Salinisphaera sp. Q1T1-3]
MATEPAAGTGERIRQLRIAQGLSIRELARRSDISHVSISLIERERHSPSVSSLKAILDALGTTLSAFFSDPLPDRNQVVYRADELVELADGYTVSYRQVGRDLTGAAMMILHERYEPGADTGEAPYQHAAEEGGVVVAGRLELTVGDKISVLGPGDAYYFDSRQPHRMRNPFTLPCVVISAVSPPTF